MNDTSQNRAIKNYRARLEKRGLARFDVLGLNVDRELIRSLARRLAQNDPEATRIRFEVHRTITAAPSETGGILAALRRSPLVGEDLRMVRSSEPGRKTEL
jgi:hypothetical protein